MLADLEQELTGISDEGDADDLARLLLIGEKYSIKLAIEGNYSIAEMKQFTRAAYISEVSSSPGLIESGMRPFTTRHFIGGKWYDYTGNGVFEER